MTAEALAALGGDAAHDLFIHLSNLQMCCQVSRRVEASRVRLDVVVTHADADREESDL